MLSLGFLCELLNRVGEDGMEKLYTGHNLSIAEPTA
jgi:hypothetical protein